MRMWSFFNARLKVMTVTRRLFELSYREYTYWNIIIRIKLNKLTI